MSCALAGRLLPLYRGRITAEKLPASLRTPYELLAWARPERAESDVTGLEQSAHWIDRWLVLCLPGEEDLQNALCCVILVEARSPSPEVRILMTICLRLQTNAAAPTWTSLFWL